MLCLGPYRNNFDPKLHPSAQRYTIQLKAYLISLGNIYYKYTLSYFVYFQSSMIELNIVKQSFKKLKKVKYG